MSYSNPFDLLADYDNDDPSLLIADRLKAAARSAASSSSRPKKPLAPTQPTVNAPARVPSKPVPQPKPEKEATVSCGFDDVENNCVLESGFYRKFTVAEDGEVEVEKPSCRGGRGGRSLRIGGLRRSYRIISRHFCRPGRAYIDEESEAFAVMLSSKYKLFDRHGPLGRGTAVREGFGRWKWGMMDNGGLEERPVGLTNNCSGTFDMIEMRALENCKDDVNDNQRALENCKDDVNDNQTDEDECYSEDKEMMLTEYEKVIENKRKAFQAMLMERSADKNIVEEFIKQGLEKELASRTDGKEELVDGVVGASHMGFPDLAMRYNSSCLHPELLGL